MLHQTARSTYDTEAGHWSGGDRSLRRPLSWMSNNENVTQAVSTRDRFQRSFNLHWQNLLLSASQPDIDNGIAVPFSFMLT